MSLTVSASFTSAIAGSLIALKQGDLLTYSVSGTFVGTVVLEKSFTAGQTWVQVASAATTASNSIEVQNPDGGAVYYRFRCSAYTSGTIVTSLVRASKTLQEFRDRDGNLLFKIDEDGIATAVRTSKTRVQATSAKVGGTSGWAVGAATDIGRMATCPASQTGSTLVVPIAGLKVGDTITGFGVIGQIESAGGAVTLDAELRKLTSAAADLTDASVGSITQVSVIADSIVSSTKASLSDTVGDDETFYILITATTAAATDIDLQGVSITVTEA